MGTCYKIPGIICMKKMLCKISYVSFVQNTDVTCLCSNIAKTGGKKREGSYSNRFHFDFQAQSTKYWLSKYTDIKFNPVSEMFVE